MAWMFLVLAGVCEIGWPVGLKLGWGADGARWAWIVFAAVCMTASGGLLLLAQREIPMGTASQYGPGSERWGHSSSAFRLLATPAAPCGSLRLL
jgi:Small Multidrug Resistance protein